MLVRFGLIKRHKFAALSFAFLPKFSLFITFFKIIVFINICKKDGFVTEADPIRFIVLWRFSVDRWRRWKNAGVSRNILIPSRRYANLGFWKRISVVTALWGSKVIQIWRIYVSACRSMHASGFLCTRSLLGSEEWTEPYEICLLFFPFTALSSLSSWVSTSLHALIIIDRLFMPFLSEISILEVSLLNVWCARMFSELRGIFPRPDLNCS